MILATDDVWLPGPTFQACSVPGNHSTAKFCQSSLSWPQKTGVSELDENAKGKRRMRDQKVESPCSSKARALSIPTTWVSSSDELLDKSRLSRMDK